VSMYICTLYFEKSSKNRKCGEFRVRVWEANKKKQKLEVMFRVLGFAQRCVDFEESCIVMFRVLGFAQRCIDFEESCIVILNVRVYLLSPVYSHGQLYVVISQVTSNANMKIFSGQGPDGYMRNVVYKEVLEM